MSTEATEKNGVSTQNNERLSAIEVIAQRNEEEQKRYQTEMGGETAGDVEETEESPADEPKEEPEDEAPEVEETTDEVEEEPEDPEHELVIDGVTTKVPLSKITDAGKRALQKELAADKRLEEATRLLNEARENSRPSEPDAEIEKPPIVGADDIQKLQYGDEDEAAGVMARLMESNKMTPDQISEIVKAQVTQQLESKNIVDRFNADFKDIVDDPYLFSIVSKEVDGLLESGEPNSYETYQKAGEKIREWRGVKNGDGLDEKRDRKKKIVDIQSASTKTPAPVAEKPETVQDVIAQMRVARHQTQ